MDYSLPSSSIHGIFQARVLEWGSIAFSAQNLWDSVKAVLRGRFIAILEKAMATHSSILAWRIPGTEKPSGLPSMGSHRVGHD